MDNKETSVVEPYIPIALNALHKYLTPLDDTDRLTWKHDLVPPLDMKSSDVKSHVIDVTDNNERTYKLLESGRLRKLQFDGKFDDSFKLDVLIYGNYISCYRAAFKHILEANDYTLDFNIPNIWNSIEIVLRGFVGKIIVTADMVGYITDNTSVDLDNTSNRQVVSFYHKGGNTRLIPLTTDILMTDENPIEKVVIEACIKYTDRHTDGPSEDVTTVIYDSKTLDEEYTRYTGKKIRPKNFAICTIKNKELKFSLYTELAVYVNDIKKKPQQLGYLTHDVYTYNDGDLIVRYSFGTNLLSN